MVGFEDMSLVSLVGYIDMSLTSLVEYVDPSLTSLVEYVDMSLVECVNQSVTSLVGFEDISLTSLVEPVDKSVASLLESDVASVVLPAAGASVVVPVCVITGESLGSDVTSGDVVVTSSVLTIKPVTARFLRRSNSSNDPLTDSPCCK